MDCLADFQQIYAEKGYLIMASMERLKLGPLERNDWNEDDMCEFRWSVIADATKDELEQQNRASSCTPQIDPRFRHFYRVVAMD